MYKQCVGQEIFYCSVCQSQLRSSDFDKGKAYKLDLDAVCVACAPAALKTFPAHKLEQLQKAMAAGTSKSSSSSALPASTPRTGTGRVPLATSTPKSGTGRVPLASSPTSTRRVNTASEEKNLKPLLLGLAIAAVLIVGGLLSLSGRRPVEERETRNPGPVPTSPIVEIPLPPRPTDTSRDQVVKEAARKAHLYADTHPTEYLEQIRLFEQAAIEAKGTGFEKDVAKALEAARRRVHDAGEVDLKALDVKTREACAKDDFKSALQILEAARKKPVTPEWTFEIDRRVQDLQARIDTAYAKVRVQALLAKPDSAEQKALREKISSWGMDRLLSDLDRAIADAATVKSPPPPPPSNPTTPDTTPKPAAVTAEAFGASWNAALLLACGRDFAPALQELEKSAAGLDDPALKAQAAADLEILRAVGALHADALQTLSKWPAGKKISVMAVDFDNVPHKVEGLAARVRPGTMEFQKGRGLSFGHITPRSLAELAPPKNKATAAIACLIEGDAQGAKELGGENNPAVPARYWAWASEAQRLLSEGDQAKREGAARYGYYFAMLSQAAPALHADAALKCRKILEESSGLLWVRRNRALLKATGETAREFIAGPAQLRPFGMFRLEVPKTTPYWMSSIDIDPDKRRDNYVEMDYSTLPEVPYRAWAYVGVCCNESLAFWAQGTELPGAAPGTDPGEPLKHAITSATKNHAGHAGRKGPSRWAWVEIPLPKFAAPGPKVLRLLTGSQGFSVAFMVVSPTRDKAPTDLDVKEWEKDLVHNAGPAGPTIGLAAWFRADAGTVIEAGKVAQWQDQSGHARHALQTMPANRPQLIPNALNTKPVLRFDGLTNAMQFECPVNGQSGLTIFLVSSAAKNQAGNDLGNYAALQWPEFGPWGAVFISPQQQKISYRFGTAQFGNLGFWDRQANGGPTLTMTRKDGPREELWVQGALVASAKDKNWLVAHTTDLALIGAGGDNPKTPKGFAGDIAEILVFTRALSEAERDALERYLRGKYGI